MKQTGILLHLSSLPGDFGIGDLGPQAYAFADYLSRNGHKIWQILPLNHCGYGNSPYNPLSALAINPYLISPELLFENGLISRSDLETAELPNDGNVYYELVARTKDKLLAKAAENWLLHNDLEHFLEVEAPYLKPYLSFVALSHLYGDSDWSAWSPEHRRYSEALYRQLRTVYPKLIVTDAVAQALLREQLGSFKSYLDQQHITLVGDIPLYLAYESAEVWAHQEWFDLDEQGRRLHFAGVPPDAFASEGQLWGNPLYRWDRLREQGFSLIMERMAQALNYLDVLRLDHFIGYVNYWQVDCAHSATGEPVLPQNALQGRWVEAVPEDFFQTLITRFGKGRFLAEDLGILNERVCRIRDGFAFPGMIVLQFCFEESVPDIGRFPADRWLYTGTHDNATTRGWYESLTPESPSYRNLHEYCRQNRLRDCHATLSPENIHTAFKNIALASPCAKVIFPMQDILGLDNDARMNTPGTALGNWQWRLSKKL